MASHGASTARDFHATRACYIKLGEAGSWVEACLKEGVLRIGFDSHKQRVFKACNARDWETVRAYWTPGKAKGTATSYMNQLRAVYEDDGETLWFTFHDRLLYWAMLDTTPPWRDSRDGSYRRCTNGWQCRDLTGQALAMASISGGVSSKQNFQGTLFRVNDQTLRYLVHKVTGTRLPEVTCLTKALSELHSAVLPAIQLLHPKDFELLVELIFSASGWRRVSVLGGNQKDTDLDLELPTTGERALVQVKSSTTQAEFDRYAELLQNPDTPYSRLFYAFHTGCVSSSNATITLLNPERIAAMTANAGLTKWVLDKVS
jgi:hypothetical protein